MGPGFRLAIAASTAPARQSPQWKPDDANTLVAKETVLGMSGSVKGDTIKTTVSR